MRAVASCTAECPVLHEPPMSHSLCNGVVDVPRHLPVPSKPSSQIEQTGVQASYVSSAVGAQKKAHEYSSSQRTPWRTLRNWNLPIPRCMRTLLCRNQAYKYLPMHKVDRTLLSVSLD
jgi:hypothetical protein